MSLTFHLNMSQVTHTNTCTHAHAHAHALWSSLSHMCTPSPFPDRVSPSVQSYTAQTVRLYDCSPIPTTCCYPSAFGGHPSTSPASFPLYSAVIAESTPLALPVETIPVATKHYAHVVDETGCPAKNAEVCLRNLTWQAVVDAQIKAQQKLYPTLPLSMFMPYGPVVNGVELTASPIDLVNQGKANKVPLIIGTFVDTAAPPPP